MKITVTPIYSDMSPVEIDIKDIFPVVSFIDCIGCYLDNIDNRKKFTNEVIEKIQDFYNNDDNDFYSTQNYIEEITGAYLEMLPEVEKAENYDLLIFENGEVFIRNLKDIACEYGYYDNNNEIIRIEEDLSDFYIGK